MYDFVGMRKLVQAVVVILFVGTVINFVKTTRRLAGVSREIQAQRDNLVRLEREQKELLAKKAEVETPGFVEKEAREKLGMGREGETILVLPDQNEIPRPPSFAEASAGRQMTNQVLENLENWERWAVVFGFKK